MSEQSSSDKDSTIRYRNLYESPGKIYTRKISGFYQSIRRYTGLPLIAAFILIPWLVIDGRPAMHFDLPARQFHIFWLTFWPQDFMLLAWLLIISAFALFTVTVLLGRVYCGFTCPQTVWTLMFISVERFFQGDRNKQMKLAGQAWGFNKVWRVAATHSVWVLIAFITGVTFVGYFVPIRELLLGLFPYADPQTGILTIGAHPVAAFWTLFFAGATYLNAGWMREQVCKYMCPYARFQSVMYDENTLAVQYDLKRGEARGPRKPKDDYKAKGLGDCIDCSWCVQVCPVDIDIRDGLQYECINCGLCVDACNAVMDKMAYPQGLIRFTSTDELASGKTNFFRPRLFGYSFAVLAMISAFVYTVATRTPLSVDVIRDRGVRMYRVSGQDIQNVYTVKINNMDRDAHIYRVSVDGDYPFSVNNFRPIEIEGGEIFTLPLRISVPRKMFDREKAMVVVTVTARDNTALSAVEEASFIGPASRR
ncbi:cytochrome c oxidase accessory protein CcoG [Teredinibacter purpureus]|uniref:cytochrome c oxidase accessory protein CcoG n=1 Tax=Teredinibacter purpureus TaxID=2731756 RepID=UPI0005F7FAF5|nr:cytochrome c oxidase accessory protein CcoG [Teredinibacter purpureus]